MKKCPYCGVEYPDDATVCATDGEQLLGNAPEPEVTEDQVADAKAVEDTANLAYPDYQWTAKDAWKCIGIMVVVGFILLSLDLALYSYFPRFGRGGFGFFCRSLLHNSTYLLIAAYFARTETLRSFWQAFGLNRRPSDYVWFGLVCILTLRLFSHLMLTSGTGKGVWLHDVYWFTATTGAERYFYLVPLALLAPLFEEPIYRGFLYKAFRGSFGIGVSTALIVAWTAFTHWQYYSHSFLAAVVLSIWAVIQCHLREKSDSLWDCIICHMVFNAWVLIVAIRWSGH